MEGRYPHQETVRGEGTGVLASKSDRKKIKLHPARDVSNPREKLPLSVVEKKDPTCRSKREGGPALRDLEKLEKEKRPKVKKKETLPPQSEERMTALTNLWSRGREGGEFPEKNRERAGAP